MQTHARINPVELLPDEPDMQAPTNDPVFLAPDDPLPAAPFAEPHHHTGDRFGDDEERDRSDVLRHTAAMPAGDLARKLVDDGLIQNDRAIVKMWEERLALWSEDDREHLTVWLDARESGRHEEVQPNAKVTSALTFDGTTAMARQFINDTIGDTTWRPGFAELREAYAAVRQLADAASSAATRWAFKGDVPVGALERLATVLFARNGTLALYDNNTPEAFAQWVLAQDPELGEHAAAFAAAVAGDASVRRAVEQMQALAHVYLQEAYGIRGHDAGHSERNPVGQ